MISTHSESIHVSFSQLLGQVSADLPVATREQISQFYERVVKENEVQNLTRLVSPSDFYYGHVVDVLELLKSGFVDYPAVDLGSGAGIPGLLAALIQSNQWILVESEKKKAEYLQRAVDSLSLNSQVKTVPQRVEDYLKHYSAKSIVARAVGPVERIYSWIRSCSTWNNLVLLKGPGWDEEWAKFLLTKYRNELKIASVHVYEVGPECKHRKIIKLTRVPRGTIRS